MLAHKHSQPSWPSRVVILGAGGFVARAFSDRMRASGVTHLVIGSSEIDLSDPGSGSRLRAALQPGDALVVTAALTPEKGRDVATLIKNMRMAEAVACAIRDKPVAQLVYFSSDAVYGGEETFSERSPPSPGDLYGLMHRGRELALQEAANKAAVPYCILRPSAIYGPGDTHKSYGPNRFVRTSIEEGRIQLFGGGEEIRDHVFIADVVSLAAEAVGRCSSGVINLVSGQPVPFATVAELVARLSPRTSKIESLPRSGPVTHRSFDTAELRQSFPGHVSTPLEDGLKKSIDAFSNA